MAKPRFEKRFLLLGISVLEMLLFSGIIYGWTSLVYILKQEGYFSDLCGASSSNSTEQHAQINCQGSPDSNSSSHGAHCHPKCLQQDATLTQVFAISVIMSQVASLFAGMALDYLGLRFIRTCFSTLVATAALFLGFSKREYPYVLFVYPGMILLGMCANVTLLANVTVGNLFGSRRSTVITIITGSFGSSPITFLVQKLLYTHFDVPFQHMCFALACLCVPSLLATFTLYPNKFLPNVQQGNSKDDQETQELHQESKEDSGPAQPRETFVQAMTSRLYLFHLAYVSIMNLNVIILLGTANIWFNTVTRNNNEQVSFWTDVLGFFQMSNVLVSPLCGFVYDLGLKSRFFEGPTQNARRRAAVPVFVVTSLVSSLLFFFTTLSVWDAPSVDSSTGLAMTSAPDMFLTFALHIVSRAFIYGGNTAFIANSFPAEHLGRLIGLSYLVAGLVGLLQYPLITWIKTDGSPFYVYVFVFVVSVLTFGHPAYIKYHCRDVSELEDSARRLPSSTQQLPKKPEYNNPDVCHWKETCV